MNPIICLLLALYSLAQGAEQGDPSVLTQVDQILNLTGDQARANLPVHLRGVIISSRELESGTAVIHDGKSAVFIRVPLRFKPLMARTNELEIVGKTEAGQFAPIVMVQEVHLIGPGVIPLPQPVTYEDLLLGGLDCQWVEIGGILRTCNGLTNVYPRLAPGMECEVATGGGRLLISLLGRRINPAWIDGCLKIRGICLHKFNQKRQFYQVFVVVPDGEDVQLTVPPPGGDPFALPPREISSLTQYSPSKNLGHRVHIQGIVTYHQPGEFLYIHDRGGSVLVRTLAKKNAVLVGDEVSVIGFPGLGNYSPIIEDASLKVVAHGNKLPSARVVQNPAEAFEQDAELITGRACFLGMLEQEAGWVLSLQMDNAALTAFLQKPEHASPAPEIEPGSEVYFTGICSVMMGMVSPQNPIQTPQSFRVLLRSPGDLQLIRPPPWWTRQRILIAAVVVAVLLSMGIVLVSWGSKTRLQRQQAARHQAEAEFAAILSERNRLAREIHDTLAQDLAAISAQLEIIRTQLPAGAEAAEAQIQRARTIVRNSLAEARRSIFNMRSQVLETGDLAAALRNLLEQKILGRKTKGTVNIRGQVRRLAPAIENDLLRIGQEAIHNAVRHGQPQLIKVDLSFAGNKVVLKIRDDGCGFTMDRVAATKGTHFGIVGMRERAGSNGGILLVNSQPGRGTEITLEIQLSEGFE